MLRKVTLFAVVLSAWAAVSLQAQKEEDFQWWESCQQMIDECKQTEAELIWWAASLDEQDGAPFLGTCYTHDTRSCPDCHCWDYVKLSYLEDQKGHDGGTGCMGYRSSISTSPAASRAAAAALLKQLCEQGKCCCPQVEEKDCEIKTKVKARDPITGSCCTFPNPCSAPSDWEQPIQPWDYRCS